MNEFVYKLTLDLNCAKTPPVICSGQFDKGRKFEFSITANGESFDVTGCSAVLKGVRTDGSHFAVECTVTDGKIIKTLNDTTLSVRGKTVAKLVISDSEKSYSTQMFIIDVDSSLDGDITIADDYSILNRLIEQIHALNESGAILIDDTIDKNSNNAVANSAVASALEENSKYTAAFVTKLGTNLFCPSNVINANIDGTNKVIVASPTSMLGYIKCNPNTTYTVIRNTPISSRFIIGSTEIEPTANVPVSVIKSQNTLTALTFTTDSSANYIVFYFYIQKYDGEYSQSFAENIMVAKGEVSEFVPYKETQILNEKNLPESVLNILTSSDNRFNTKSKIYGVTFRNSDTSSFCQRIGNAVGLKTDYVVGDNFQNGGKNDFDSIFPWCDIRRCNLTVEVDGKKTITYEGEDGFATDGSNGNVMVEIPKFYSYREVLNGSEIWAITGEPKSGFTVEPAFIGNDGKELDYIYVGAYQFTGTSTVNEHSKSGSFVQTGLKLAQYRTIANAVNMQCLDFAAIHALQMLFVVEFADRDTDKYMQGVSYLPWFSSSNAPISAISDDRLTVTVSKVNRVTNLRAEQNVMVCQGASKKQENLTIIDILENADDTVSITLDTAISSDIDVSAGNIYISGQAQRCGLTDTLAYHTGRISTENALSPFRYRWIENIWGNAWEILEGIRVKELKYYYTFNPAQYADTVIDDWEVSQIIAPNQPYLGDDGKNRAWISKMGYDINDRQIILPSACSTSGATDKYYSSALYTLYDADKDGNKLDDTTIEYLCVFGGGYDHNKLCGLFTMRFWFASEKESSSLHTSRLIYR